MGPREEGTPRRRLRHRIPTRLRRYWKWPAALGVFLLVVIVTMGGLTVRPYISGDERVIESDVTENIAGTVDLFDDSIEHDFSMKISDAEYAEMVDSYVKNGEKKWVTADVVVDGTLVKDVGVRLKGNSTLQSLRGGMRPPGGKKVPEGMQPPPGMQLPDGEQRPGQSGRGGEPNGGVKPDGQGVPRGGPAGLAQLSANDPTSLPLLLSFDHNAQGRAYQGMTELSVRPGSPVLNEAMALALTKATGQPTQRFAYTVYSVNDSESTTRLLLEHPDAGYADSLSDSDGYLFKADASSRFEYVDDDQSSYSDQFKQINSDGNGNLEPIISFLKWVDSADDTEFDAHLADWVDVDSFADYLATQNLLANMDDMSGPGQNYYLWYDLDSKKISVISWDLNLAMQGNADAGPHDSISIGGMFGKAAGGEARGGQAPGGVAPDKVPGSAGPAGGKVPGGMGGGNELKTRFLDSAKFTAVYDDAYWKLFDEIYGQTTATDTLNQFASSIPVSDQMTSDDLAKEVTTMRDWITERTEALASERNR
ncbi:CotH kinase family protein [Gordonia liuliyuniae]|uniref:CotH kinase family protein n=1 Tax=Gordonia liuliyuniae TaxID=2911517 RepID=A0ABS9IU57_9ACTN|nr:CotH kinase family protein [Gordonia liuliyuniae]MCF8589097.1 CotH kinase family protein [Gordonia liuliyuniae]